MLLARHLCLKISLLLEAPWDKLCQIFYQLFVRDVETCVRENADGAASAVQYNVFFLCESRSIMAGLAKNLNRAS